MIHNSLALTATTLFRQNTWNTSPRNVSILSRIFLKTNSKRNNNFLEMKNTVEPRSLEPPANSNYFLLPLRVRISGTNTFELARFCCIRFSDMYISLVQCYIECSVYFENVGWVLAGIESIYTRMRYGACTWHPNLSMQHHALTFTPTLTPALESRIFLLIFITFYKRISKFLNNWILQFG